MFWPFKTFGYINHVRLQNIATIDQQCLYSLAGWYKSEFMATNISFQKTKSLYMSMCRPL